MNTCTHVFLRIDSVKRPLEQPYEGPYKIIERISDFVFRIDHKGQSMEVSTDRLKPTFHERQLENIQSGNANTSPAPRTYPGPKTQRHVYFAI